MATPQDIDALLRQGHADKALKGAQALARRRPKDSLVLDVLARAFQAAGNHKLALSTYERLGKIASKSAKPLADKALLLQQMGQMDQAEEALRRGLKREPLNGSLLRMLSATTRLGPGDPDLIRVLSAWEAGEISAQNRAEAGFGIGKALAAEGFPFLAEANEILRRASPFDLTARQKEVEGLKRAFSTRDWPALPPVSTTARPIFVTGMPRSGTSLVEQILACHRDVHLTGETGLPLRAAYSVLTKGGQFRSPAGIASDQLALISRRYLDGMAHFHGVRGVFTDKSIQTYLIMGLMHLLMPNARCIVVRRDPRDTGWSIYRNFFAPGTHTYANGLEDIAAYMRVMDEMITFWRERRPEAFIELRYEDLVTDPEPQIRHMLNYCDLDWDPACLTPEKYEGSVRTLSLEQVRSPISPKSIGGWRRFSDELSPMIEALGDLVQPWD